MQNTYFFTNNFHWFQGSEECPITMDPYDQSGVDFLPGFFFIKNREELCAAKLPCGHHVSIIPLVYHMLVTSMTCPMCRAGPGGKLATKCLPAHIRAPMKKRAAAIALEAHQAQVEQDREIAYEMVRDLLQTDAATDILSAGFDHPINQLCIKVSVYFYTSRSISENANTQMERFRQVYTHEYTMETQNNQSYSVKQADLLHIVECINTLPIVGIRFTVHTLSITEYPVKLSSTRLFEVSELADWDVLTLGGIDGLGNAQTSTQSDFVITRNRHSERLHPSHHRAPPNCAAPISLDAIEWNSQQHILQRLLGTPLEWMPIQ